MALGFQFQLLAFPFSSWLTSHLPLPLFWGTAELLTGNLVQAGVLCGRLVFSSNPEGDDHKSLQP